MLQTSENFTIMIEKILKLYRSVVRNQLNRSLILSTCTINKASTLLPSLQYIETHVVINSTGSFKIEINRQLQDETIKLFIRQINELL